MILRVLFGQRIERYEGEYGPEALACVDEYTDDENPEFFQDRVESITGDLGEEFEGFAIVKIKVDADKIREFCVGAHPVQDGEIEGGEKCE
jgi:hypothetical protein